MMRKDKFFVGLMLLGLVVTFAGISMLLSNYNTAFFIIIIGIVFESIALIGFLYNAILKQKSKKEKK